MTEKIYGGPGAPRWQGYKPGDELQEEARLYTKADMIRAYCAGAKRVFLGEYLNEVPWTDNIQKTAEALAELYIADRKEGE